MADSKGTSVTTDRQWQFRDNFECLTLSEMRGTWGGRTGWDYFVDIMLNPTPSSSSGDFGDIATRVQ